MSQVRAVCLQFRAAFAVAAICALFFGLVTSGAAQASHDLRADLSAAAGDVACDRHPAQPAGDAVAPGRADPRKHHGHCPDCCLAAHAGAAVLPERCAPVFAPTALRPRPIVYFAHATRAPESFLSSDVNGARAPPALLPNS